MYVTDMPAVTATNLKSLHRTDKECHTTNRVKKHTSQKITDAPVLISA